MSYKKSYTVSVVTYFENDYISETKKIHSQVMSKRMHLKAVHLKHPHDHQPGLCLCGMKVCIVLPSTLDCTTHAEVRWLDITSG